MKIPELLANATNEKYIKSENEDFNTLLKGITGQKKHIHIHAGTPINADLDALSDITNANQLIKAIAQVIDNQIISNYKLWATNYTLDIAPGETIAIMGRVGSGKTTLLSMLVRLLDPPPGTLLIDGWDVRAFGLAQLRQQVVLVPQDPFLFAEVLRHNLSYDDPQRDEDLVWQAVDDASLLATVKSFAQALETPVGERGVTLSGGQKQRSTLARGLVRDAPVLVLDDCFSSVDTETEEHILERLFAARRGRTTLLVTNRVSTARHADRIVVLDAGRIVQVGAHAGLLQSPGWYADLDRIQRRRTQAGMALHAAGGG